jgi:hypothetical protein
MGRPKKEITKNTYFQIRMEQEIYDLLVTTARKQGVSKAEIVRRGIVAQAKLTKHRPICPYGKLCYFYKSLFHECLYDNTLSVKNQYFFIERIKKL